MRGQTARQLLLEIREWNGYRFQTHVGLGSAQQVDHGERRKRQHIRKTEKNASSHQNNAAEEDRAKHQAAEQHWLPEVRRINASNLQLAIGEFEQFPG